MVVDITENGARSTVSAPLRWVDGEHLAWPDSSNHSKYSKSGPSDDWARFPILQYRLERTTKDIADQFVNLSSESVGKFFIPKLLLDRYSTNAGVPNAFFRFYTRFNINLKVKYLLTPYRLLVNLTKLLYFGIKTKYPMISQNRPGENLYLGPFLGGLFQTKKSRFW